MKPLQELLNDQLEQNRLRSGPHRQHPSGFLHLHLENEYDLEVENLLLVARKLRTAPQLQVHANFIRRTERRMLRRSAELRLRGVGQKRAGPPFWHALRMSALAVLLLVLLVGVAVLVTASQVSNPTNPLYVLKHLEQHLQVSLSHNPADRATLDLQFTHECLMSLSALANTAHTPEYTQALADLDQQVRTTRVAINSLPADSQQRQLSGELAALQTEAIRMLRGFLSRLALSARLETTGELAHLGERVPILLHATVAFPFQTKKPVTIYLTGRNLPARASLLADGKQLNAVGVLQQGQLVFVLATWPTRPRSLGILTPDSMAVQTTAVTTSVVDAQGKTG